MEKLKPVLFPILAEVLRADGQTIDGIYERNDEALRAKDVYKRQVVFLNAEKGSLQKQAESGLFAQTCDLIWTMPT